MNLVIWVKQLIKLHHGIQCARTIAKRMGNFVAANRARINTTNSQYNRHILIKLWSAVNQQQADKDDIMPSGRDLSKLLQRLKWMLLSYHKAAKLKARGKYREGKECRYSELGVKPKSVEHHLRWTEEELEMEMYHGAVIDIWLC